MALLRLTRSLAIWLPLLALGSACAGADDGEGGFTFGTSYTTTTYSTSAATTVGDGDGDQETSGADAGDGAPGDGDGDGPAPVCGDGQVNGNEVCDGSDLAGETCASLGYGMGPLACLSNCMGYDTSNCMQDLCGNGVIDPGELCDGSELGGQTCVTIGYAGGQLACNPTCKSYNVDGCMDGPVCGNGVIEQGEVCDGNNLNGQSCITLGYDGGTLSCNGSCTGFNTGNCFLSNDGDCCLAHAYVGCQSVTITNCVCGIDPYCCDTEWDSYCVSEALDCGAAC